MTSRAAPSVSQREWQLTRYPRPFRRHQHEALQALGTAFSGGARRAWVVLPPGAGKTVVGLEAARRLGNPVIAFGPNTAIQSQWIGQWAEFSPALIPAGTDRDLAMPVTALTYQSLATFDPDAEVDEEGRQHLGAAGRRKGASLLDRLRPNGLALIEALRALGPVTLILDECHHLLEVWGRLLAELLDELPDARVIGLTGTPPGSLTAEQAALVDDLFGAPLYSTSIPAVVREGHLAPFAELAWFTVPTPTESDWLAAQAERFTELTTDLLAPGPARVGFLPWLDARFVARRHDLPPTSPDAPDATTPGPALSWSRIERDAPELAGAALRMHHAGLVAMPDGATLREEHRHDPTADDWVALLDDYLKSSLLGSERAGDLAVLEEIRRALPGIGYHLTKRGIRRGRSPVDRVLARSEAKTTAAVEILAAEADALGDRLRALVLCDHERASATLPAGLRGVLDAEAGSARLVLANLLGDDRTARLRPVLVTGRTVAADAATARDLVAFARRASPHLVLDDIEPDATGIVEVGGQWRARSWVPLVTGFYESGATGVLVGTRGLLGEGWDARGVNTLVDLTTATTPTAVVQTRGRALRIDPEWPEKVADIWTVVCVSEDHPGGTGDWSRFVRKHHGYFAVTDAGEIASGVGHVDPRLSPYAPPAAEQFHAENALMLARSADRARVRELWRVGTPYRDDLLHTIRVTSSRPVPAAGPVVPGGAAQPTRVPPRSVPAAHGALTGGLPATTAAFVPPAYTRAATVAGVGAAALAAVVAVVVGLPLPIGLIITLLAGSGAVGVVRGLGRRRAQLEAGSELAALSVGPDVSQLAYAVADGLEAAGLSPVGAAAVTTTVDADGTYRLALDGVETEVSALFTASLDEVLSPLVTPRYVVARHLVEPITDPAELRRAGRAWLHGSAPSNAVVYHAVPTVLGVNAGNVEGFVTAWSRWVSAGEATRTATPEGEGILATHRGASPFDATTALRIAWR